MIPIQYRDSPVSNTSDEITAILQTELFSMQEIQARLNYRYCLRTVAKWVGILHNAGIIEGVIKDGDMRKPRYRVKK